MMLKVSDLAAASGLSSDTVRYYERFGLLHEPQRTQSGYRQYDEEVIDRLRFIKGAQRFGLRLREIRELLDIHDRGQCPCGHTHELLKARIAEVTDEMRRLQRLRTDLVDMVEQVEACTDPDASIWPCAPGFIEGKEVTSR
jgi:DNA-binding transcriptional MerR regulator